MELIVQIDTYAMIDGKLAKWEVVADSYKQAIAGVKAVMQLPPTKPVLASVYLGPTQRELF